MLYETIIYTMETWALDDDDNALVVRSTDEFENDYRKVTEKFCRRMREENIEECIEKYVFRAMTLHHDELKRLKSRCLTMDNEAECIKNVETKVKYLERKIEEFKTNRKHGEQDPDMHKGFMRRNPKE